MPIVQNQPIIHGKLNIHRKQESMCKTAKEQTRSNSEATTTKDTERMQKFCMCGKLSQYVLPRITKATITHIQFNHERKTIQLGKRTTRFICEFKNRLIKPPVVHVPNKTGRFHLYSDTSKFATGSALYQIQNGKPKLIAYMSKRFPEAKKGYSITKLELYGLAINIASFSHLLKRVDFDAIVNHLALTHIIKSKMEPATARIKRLLELISSYSFNLYYMEGKDMVLSDFLLQLNNDNSNLNEIIPISFDMYKILENNLNNFDQNNNLSDDKYSIQMCSQAKTSGTKLPENHGVGKA